MNRSTPSTTSHRAADPAAVARLTRRAAEELAKHDHLGAAAIVVKLLLGVPLCIIGPFLVTIVLKLIDWNFKWGILPDFEWTFVLAMLLFLPLLFWTRRRSPESSFADQADSGGSPLDADSYTEFVVRKEQLFAAAAVDVMMLGPRLVGSALDGLRGRSGVDPALRQAAAELAAELFQAGEGVAIKSLVRPGRSWPQLVRCAAYLLDRDWVGVSGKGDRIWLSSLARGRLGAG